MTKLGSRVTRLERRAGGGGHIPRPQYAIDRHGAREFKGLWNISERVRAYVSGAPSTMEEKAHKHAADALLVGDTLARRDRDNETIEAWARSRPEYDTEAADWLHKLEAARLIRQEHPDFGTGYRAHIKDKPAPEDTEPLTALQRHVEEFRAGNAGKGNGKSH